MKLGFDNKKDAMVYYEIINENKEASKMMKQNNIGSFVISKNNFLKLLKEKSTDEYVDYFNSIYLLN